MSARVRLDPAVAALAAAGLALGLVEIALLLWRPAGEERWVALLFPVVGWIYIAAAVWVGTRLGVVLAGAGLAWLAAGLVHTSAPPLIAVGLVVAAVPLAVVVHLLHAVPSGTLRGSLSRRAVLGGYFVCVVLQAPQYLFGQDAGARTAVLQISEEPDLARAGSWAQALAGACVIAATGVVAVRRGRGAPPTWRAARTALFAYGIAAVVLVATTALLAAGTPIGGDSGLLAAQLGALALVPVALVLAMRDGGVARPSGLEELGAWLDSDDGRRSDLAAALAGWLGDDSLQVVYWVPELDAYVDAAGSELPLPPAGSERAAVEVSLGDQRVGAIVYDATRIARPALVRAGGRVVALALDNERLAAELLVSNERVRQSRARIVEAAETERRRIARDLHDSLQARLVLLAIQADRVRAELTAAGTPSRHAEELHSGLQTAITELRELVHGVVPAALAERGLYAAIREQAYRVPAPLTLELEGDDGELSELFESTAYFVVSEALTNAVKHSRATEVAVRVSLAGGRLRIEVRDDGSGGAHVGGGGGMRGIIDRVEALAGEVSVQSPPGGGTRIVAEIPVVR